jgi:hypothetical protein
VVYLVGPYLGGDDPKRLIGNLLHLVLFDFCLRQGEVEPHERFPYAQLYHVVLALLEQFEPEVGPEALLVEHNVARETLNLDFSHIVGNLEAVPPGAALGAVDWGHPEAIHAAEVVQRLGQHSNGVVHQHVVGLKFYNLSDMPCNVIDP